MQDLMKKPEFRAMVDVQVYPYGNGQLSGNTVTCQHGADECVGNQIIACMQKKYPITEASPGFFPAFACMESKDGKPVDEGQACATENSESLNPRSQFGTLRATRTAVRCHPVPLRPAPFVAVRGERQWGGCTRASRLGH